jgi:phosphate-selective porin OprO and OprP
VGAFGLGVLNPLGGQSTGGGQYYDVTGRMTYAPIKDEHNFLHFGASARYHRPNDATGNLGNGGDQRVLNPGLNLASEANVLGLGGLGGPDLSCGTNIPFGGASFVSGKCVRDVVTYNFELAGAYGPVSVQAEYFGSNYHRDSSAILQNNLRSISGLTSGFTPFGSSYSFNGWYVATNWWVTGEEKARSYNTADTNGATIGAPKILHPLSEGGPGAIGLVARYSTINLNNGSSGNGFVNLLPIAPSTAARAALFGSSYNGGRESIVSGGLQWYPDNGIHVNLLWSHVTDLGAPVLAGNVGLGANTQFVTSNAFFNHAHPDIFEARVGVYW